MVTGVFLYPLNNIEDQRTGKELISQPTKPQNLLRFFPQHFRNKDKKQEEQGQNNNDKTLLVS